MRSTTSVEDCATAIVDGFEARKARVFIPKGAALIHYLRTAINSSMGERVIAKDAATMVPRMEREVADLGRAGSERTARINDLQTSDAAEAAEEVT